MSSLPRSTILVRWTTASELDNFGFHVYRSRSEEGPFERLTEESIPGAGTTDETNRYEFLDRSVEAGEEYFYFVESISVDGERKRLTPTRRFRAQPVDDQVR